MVEWIVDGIADQAIPGDEIEVIAVDPRATNASRSHRGISVRWVAPKPNPWQGPQRLTRRDWWAASSARNTGIALASHGYLAFLDDKTRLGEGWLSRVRRASADPRAVVAGTYDKDDQPKKIVDHRRVSFPRGRRDCGGSWLYGGSFCCPLEAMLVVNGFEEGCDGLAGEDCVLGRMLINAGYRIHFDAAMTSVKERPAGTHHGFVSLDKVDAMGARKSSAALERFGRRARTEFTPDLRALRARLAAGGGFPDVDPSADHRDWFDDQPIREIDDWAPAPATPQRRARLK